ncbi:MULTISPECIES: ATP-dependent helicase [Agathobacter]|uniref:DNA 3'-5' helicase n=1 Tax=Agathobacter ruminis TaxID=1712665 RepID=A0A2G3E5G8_9FIRM|nr:MULTISPECIES: ATP-dependent helicase [Agathobacter]MBQ1681593.1 ATP-dependent helicase [Agathobacter sp.]MDC7302546.1 ATP-dependent helicase [Agathobacter ruminis]PHU38528.1 ATP-dependent helicase [Agathobacter ruminis]
MNFNESQKRAIAVCDGPAMVLAGAGSGKTTVITHRIRSLIEQHHVDPSAILVITFTKAAATEMKERFLQLIGQEKTKVTFGTFHAIFFMILKIAYHFDADNIIRENVKYNLMRELVHRYHLDARDENELCANLISEISLVKNTRIDIRYFYSKSCGESVFRDIFRDYHQYLQNNRLIDFDDMLTYTYDLFEQRKDILALWQQKYQYILIDEFQDINQIQFDIIKMMAQPQNNLFVVGDDDQSIYRFRGSKPEIMLRFPETYPDTVQILLDTNYRCDKQITDRAMKLISHNKVRFDKAVHSSRPAHPDAFRIHYFDSQEKQNQSITDWMREAMEKNESLDDYAILFRTNTGPRLLMEQFLNHNIEFRVRDQIPNLYDHWAVKDIRTYIRMAAGSRERADFYQVMNKPLRYLSRDSLRESQVAFDVWEAYYRDKPWMQERIYKLRQDLNLIAKMNPYAAINYIRKGIGYDEYLIEFAQEHDITKEELLAVLDEFQSVAKGYQTFEQLNNHIVAAQEALYEMNRGSKKVNAVTFSTLHSAKGLEFKHVILIDVNEGVMPYKKALLDEEIEEERRLFYVGMTRAMDSLHICSVKSTHSDLMVSRFVEEIIHP